MDVDNQTTSAENTAEPSGVTETLEAQNSNPEVIETIKVERASAPSATTEPLSLEEQEKLKKLGKKKISKAELKRQSVLLILGAIFFIYGIVFYYLPLAGWFMAF